MKLKNKMLYVFKNATDYSNIAYKMGVEEFSLNLITTDYLYIGYSKAFKNLFIELKTANTVALTLTLEYWNGTSWVNCDIIDETKGLKKSNFIYLADDIFNSKKNIINSIEANWVRIKVSANTSAMSCYGLNTLFCSEDDLKSEEPAIATFYPRNISSHILSMVNARDFIIRKINNSGFYKYKVVNPLNPYQSEWLYAQDFSQFDIFEIDEIRDAAICYALHKIFINRSNEKDDIFEKKAIDYLAKFNELFQLWNGRKLTLDLDKDGIQSEAEKILSVSKGTFTR